MNKNILICISVVFITSFSIFFTVSYFFPSKLIAAERDFYEQDFGSDEKIIIIGSSHVGQLNTTHIEERLRSYGDNFIVYNLAYQSDVPEKRIKTVDEIIRLKPKLVVYGFSYRDFDVSPRTVLPDPKSHFYNLISQFDIKPYNPKLVTLENIRSLSNSSLFSSTNEITFQNTPFFTYNIKTQIQIADEDELRKQIATSEAPKINLETATTNKQVELLIEIVNELKENNVKVVLFTTPLNILYLEGLNETQKLTFKEILERISADTGIRVYDLTERYAEMQIWANISHVAFNTDSLIYSNDIAEIIHNEI